MAFPLSHIAAGPVITGAGVWFMVTAVVVLLVQPPLAVVSDTLPDGPAPHTTETFCELDAPEIVPPVTLQL
jgi:hypothetical protein